MDYWLGYAKDYAVGIGLRLDENATDSWDTPIRCSSKTEDVLAAYIRDDLTYYKNEEGCTAVWIWAEQVGEGCPSPLKSVVFETLKKFQKLRQRVEKIFSTR